RRRTYLLAWIHVVPAAVSRFQEMGQPIRWIGVAMFALAVSACGPRVSTASSLSPSATAASCPQASYGKPCVAPPSPSPSGTPGAIAYIQPSSASFVDAERGWVVGHACDAQ